MANSYVPFTGLLDYDKFILGGAGTASTFDPTTIDMPPSDLPLRSVAETPPTPFDARPSRQRPTRSLLPPL